MKRKAEIRYEFKNSKSLKIHPKATRTPISNIALSSPVRVERRALNASEKEVKHLMIVANRRLDRIQQVVREKDEIIEKIMIENIRAGHHLVDEVFIPEYLGFMEIPPGEDNEIRIYSKDGHSLTRVEDGWVTISPSGIRNLFKIDSMHSAIVILSALGINVNFKDYLDCKYSPDMKSFDTILGESIEKVIAGREERKLLKK